MVYEEWPILGQQLPVLENQLECGGFLVGNELTIADIVAFSYFDTVDYSGVDIDFFPSIKKWIKEMRTRSSYQNAMRHFPNNNIFFALEPTVA